MKNKNYQYIGDEMKIDFRSPYDTFRRKGLIYLKINGIAVMEWERVWLHSFATCGLSCLKSIAKCKERVRYNLEEDTERDLVFTPQKDDVVVSYIYETRVSSKANYTKLYHDWNNFSLSVFNLLLVEEPDITNHPGWGIINNDWCAHINNIQSYWDKLENEGQDPELILEQWFDNTYNYSGCFLLNQLYKELLDDNLQ